MNNILYQIKLTEHVIKRLKELESITVSEESKININHTINRLQDYCDLEWKKYIKEYKLLR